MQLHIDGQFKNTHSRECNLVFSRDRGVRESDVGAYSCVWFAHGIQLITMREFNASLVHAREHICICKSYAILYYFIHGNALVT